MPVRSIVLASSSRYRRSLLGRLGLAFEVQPPGVDETPAPGEAPARLVLRLAEAKARAVARGRASALIIGSDQVAVADGAILGKPANLENNVQQLLAVSGKPVQFLTGLCLLNSATDKIQRSIVRNRVVFRRLTEAEVRGYAAAERAFDCAGGFRAEGLGVALFESIGGTDPTALIGLPLIRLVSMLKTEGVDPLTPSGEPQAGLGRQGTSHG